MKDIRFNLTVSEANLVLKALGNLPYYQVCAVIEKIQAQANLQLQHMNGNENHDAAPQHETSVQHS